MFRTLTTHNSQALQFSATGVGQDAGLSHIRIHTLSSKSLAPRPIRQHARQWHSGGRSVCGRCGNPRDHHTLLPLINYIAHCSPFTHSRQYQPQSIVSATMEADDTDSYIHVRQGGNRVAVPKSEVSERVLRLCAEGKADPSITIHARLLLSRLRDDPTDPYQVLSRVPTALAMQLPLGLQEYLPEDNKRRLRTSRYGNLCGITKYRSVRRPPWPCTFILHFQLYRECPELTDSHV